MKTLCAAVALALWAIPSANAANYGTDLNLTMLPATGGMGGVGIANPLEPAAAVFRQSGYTLQTSTVAPRFLLELHSISRMSAPAITVGIPELPGATTRKRAIIWFLLSPLRSRSARILYWVLG